MIAGLSGMDGMAGGVKGRNLWVSGKGLEGFRVGRGWGRNLIGGDLNVEFGWGWLWIDVIWFWLD